MNGSAGACGLLLILSSGVAWGQALATDAEAAPSEEAAPAAAPAEPASPAPETPPPTSEPPAAAQPPRSRARVRWAEPGGGAADETEVPAVDEAEPEEEARHGGWSLQGFHFVLAVERITSVLGWSNVSTAAPSDIGTSSTEVEVSGTEIAFLSAGGASRTVSGVPRLAFDVVLDIGLSLGGSLGYVASVDGESTIESNSSADQPRELPDQSISVFAPRLGLMLRPLENVGVWLRGGITRIGTSETVTFSSAAGSTRQHWDATLWQLSLDPQLVLVAAPRVAITVSALLDLGLSGTVESRREGDSAVFDTDLKSSAYGVSAGLAAIF
jgi:hypothetical protein